MAQTREGAQKINARRLGMTLQQYQQRVASGEKHCSNCQRWHKQSAFGSDRSRGDGLEMSCKESRNARSRAAYVPSYRVIPNGRSLVPARDGDKLQARRRVNYFVEAGLLPQPNELPCVDCGHEWRSGERRHEYDHHLGYAAKHHEHVEAVCSQCHHKREQVKRG